MPTVRVETRVAAPVDVCFDLARDVELHVASAAATGERVVARTGAGLLALGDEVTFEARHLGMRHRLTARVTRLEPPQLFEDRMVRGPFRALAHLHEFLPTAADGAEGANGADERGSTRVVDTLTFRSPLGPAGWIVDRLVLARHLRRFLEGRAAYLKRAAERLEPLCALLLDGGAPVADRDDAAMDLGALGHRSALGALVRAGSDATVADVVRASCGEAIAEIWLRTGTPAPGVLPALTPAARHEAVGLIRARRPEWLAALGAHGQRCG